MTTLEEQKRLAAEWMAALRRALSRYDKKKKPEHSRPADREGVIVVPKQEYAYGSWSPYEEPGKKKKETTITVPKQEVAHGEWSPYEQEPEKKKKATRAYRQPSYAEIAREGKPTVTLEPPEPGEVDTIILSSKRDTLKDIVATINKEVRKTQASEIQKRKISDFVSGERERLDRERKTLGREHRWARQQQDRLAREIKKLSKLHDEIERAPPGTVWVTESGEELSREEARQRVLQEIERLVQAQRDLGDYIESMQEQRARMREYEDWLIELREKTRNARNVEFYRKPSGEIEVYYTPAGKPEVVPTRKYLEDVQPWRYKPRASGYWEAVGLLLEPGEAGKEYRKQYKQALGVVPGPVYRVISATSTPGTPAHTISRVLEKARPTTGEVIQATTGAASGAYNVIRDTALVGKELLELGVTTHPVARLLGVRPRLPERTIAGLAAAGHAIVHPVSTTREWVSTKRAEAWYYGPGEVAGSIAGSLTGAYLVGKTLETPSKTITKGITKRLPKRKIETRLIQPSGSTARVSTFEVVPGSKYSVAAQARYDVLVRKYYDGILGRIFRQKTERVILDTRLRGSLYKKTGGVYGYSYDVYVNDVLHHAVGSVKEKVESASTQSSGVITKTTMESRLNLRGTTTRAGSLKVYKHSSRLKTRTTSRVYSQTEEGFIEGEARGITNRLGYLDRLTGTIQQATATIQQATAREVGLKGLLSYSELESIASRALKSVTRLSERKSRMVKAPKPHPGRGVVSRGSHSLAAANKRITQESIQEQASTGVISSVSASTVMQQAARIAARSAVRASINTANIERITAATISRAVASLVLAPSERQASRAGARTKRVGPGSVERPARARMQRGVLGVLLPGLFAPVEAQKMGVLVAERTATRQATKTIVRPVTISPSIFLAPFMPIVRYERPKRIFRGPRQERISPAPRPERIARTALKEIERRIAEASRAI